MGVILASVLSCSASASVNNESITAAAFARWYRYLSHDLTETVGGKAYIIHGIRTEVEDALPGIALNGPVNPCCDGTFAQRAYQRSYRQFHIVINFIEHQLSVSPLRVAIEDAVVAVAAYVVGDVPGALVKLPPTHEVRIAACNGQAAIPVSRDGHIVIARRRGSLTTMIIRNRFLEGL